MLKIGTFNKKEPAFQPIAILHTKTTQRDGLSLMVDTSKRSILPTRDVVLPEGEYFALEPSNLENGRDVIMVGGKSGSGKSHTAKNFAIRYHMLWPKRTIRLISFLDEDDTLDALPYIERVKAEQIKGDEDATSLKKYEKSLTIFDDIEGFERDDPEMHASLQQIIDMIATTGRHTASSLLVASHLLTDYKRFVSLRSRSAARFSIFEVTYITSQASALLNSPRKFENPPIHPNHRTRLFLGEAHKFVLFPNGCSMKQMTNLLGLYGGCDTDELKRIRKLPSRWVALCTTFPSMVIYEGGCYLLHSSEPTEKPSKKRTLVEAGSGLEAPVKPEKASVGKKSNAAAGAGDAEEEDDCGY
jgi:hypothetical protein